MVKRIVNAFVALALLSPNASANPGQEEDNCGGPDGERSALMQSVMTRTREIAKTQRHRSEPIVKGLANVSTNHNQTQHDESEAQALTEVLSQAKQAQETAAERVHAAALEVEEANKRALKEAETAKEREAKASAALEAAKKAQAKASEDLRIAKQHATKAVNKATVTAETHDMSPSALKGVSNATGATLNKAEIAEASAKLAAAMADAAAANRTWASASAEKAEKAAGAVDLKKVDVDEARRAEALVKLHSPPSDAADDWAWQDNMQHENKLPSMKTWQGDYMVDSNNPLERMAWGIKDVAATQIAASNVSNTTQVAVQASTNTSIASTDTSKNAETELREATQAHSDVVEKTKIVETQAKLAASMAANASNQSEASPTAAQQVSTAATDEVKKAKDAHEAATDFVTEAEEANRAANAEERARAEAEKANALAKLSANGSANIGQSSTIRTVAPVRVADQNWSDWERDFMRDSSNPLEAAMWNESYWNKSSSATTASSSTSLNSTATAARSANLSAATATTTVIATTADAVTTTTTTATTTTTTTTSSKIIVQNALAKHVSELKPVGWRIPSEETETGDMEVDHNNTPDLYNWKPYPEIDTVSSDKPYRSASDIVQGITEPGLSR